MKREKFTPKAVLSTAILMTGSFKELCINACVISVVRIIGTASP